MVLAFHLLFPQLLTVPRSLIAIRPLKSLGCILFLILYPRTARKYSHYHIQQNLKLRSDQEVLVKFLSIPQQVQPNKNG